jgi:hypothetical protein
VQAARRFCRACSKWLATSPNGTSVLIWTVRYTCTTTILGPNAGGMPWRLRAQGTSRVHQAVDRGTPLGGKGDRTLRPESTAPVAASTDDGESELPLAGGVVVALGPRKSVGGCAVSVSDVIGNSRGPGAAGVASSE